MQKNNAITKNKVTTLQVTRYFPMALYHL